METLCRQVFQLCQTLSIIKLTGFSKVELILTIKIRLSRKGKVVKVVEVNQPSFYAKYNVSRSTAKRYLKRYRIYVRDGFTCQSKGCGRKFNVPKGWDGSTNIPGLTLGHIIPKSQGGRYNEENLKAQCESCNTELQDNLWTDFIDWEPVTPKQKVIEIDIDKRREELGRPPLTDDIHTY